MSPSALSRKLLIGAVFCVMLLGVIYQPARADGIVIPDPPPLPVPITLEDSWLTIRYHRVSVSIDDQVAVTRVDQEFVLKNAFGFGGCNS